ncbi:MAG: hypothetical protein GX621_08440 [Pirellulaceae bacterium]|nr:hypothetical protein [Pirellulaceae bacterium]
MILSLLENDGVEMTDNVFVAELTAIEEEIGTRLDDDSIGFLAELRGNGLLQDDEWRRLKGFLRDALHYRREPEKTVDLDETGTLTICPDADPRNADWIRVVRACRLAGYRLPTWAALWLWWLRTDSSAAFWKNVGKIAEQMGFERMAKKTDR